jgi:tripartite-type tricarboxylate transporter receptor subunit TctC
MQGVGCVAALAGVLVAAGFSAEPLRAESWPQKTVRIITPNNAGSGADLTARLFAERLGERWGRPVIVENRPGADGIIAATTFLGSRDGHSLLLSFAGIITINPLIHEKLPYDPERDFVPIVSASDNFYGIAVSETLKVDSLSSFVELVRRQPGKLNWAAPPGLPYFAFMALQQSARIEMIRAPYRDFAPALSDLGEGRIQAAVSGLGVLLPQAQAGKIKLLAVTSRGRSPLVSDVPTMQESGYPNLVFGGVIGFYGWRGMPDDLKSRIAGDVRAVATDPVIAARLETIGSMVLAGSTADFVAAIEEQRARILAVTRAAETK